MACRIEHSSFPKALYPRHAIAALCTEVNKTAPKRLWFEKACRSIRTLCQGQLARRRLSFHLLNVGRDRLGSNAKQLKEVESAPDVPIGLGICLAKNVPRNEWRCEPPQKRTQGY